jgi:hypothetical protein
MSRMAPGGFHGTRLASVGPVLRALHSRIGAGHASVGICAPRAKTWQADWKLVTAGSDGPPPEHLRELVARRGAAVERCCKARRQRGLAAAVIIVCRRLQSPVRFDQGPVDRGGCWRRRCAVWPV